MQKLSTLRDDGGGVHFIDGVGLLNVVLLILLNYRLLLLPHFDQLLPPVLVLKFPDLHIYEEWGVPCKPSNAELLCPVPRAPDGFAFLRRSLMCSSALSSQSFPAPEFSPFKINNLCLTNKNVDAFR